MEKFLASPGPLPIVPASPQPIGVGPSCFICPRKPNTANSSRPGKPWSVASWKFKRLEETRARGSFQPCSERPRQGLSCRFICGYGLLKLPRLVFTLSAGRSQQLGFQTAMTTYWFCTPSIVSPLLKVSAPPINQSLSVCAAMHAVYRTTPEGTIPIYVCKKEIPSLSLHPTIFLLLYPLHTLYICFYFSCSPSDHYLFLHQARFRVEVEQESPALQG